MKRPARRSPVRWSPTAFRTTAAHGRRQGVTYTGFAWYTEEQWRRLREIAADRDKLDDTYEDWLANAENAVRTLRSQGVHVHKVFLDVEEVLAWCTRTGRSFNSRARSEFVAERLHEAK